MPDPTVIECATACTVTVVHEISIPVLNLSLEEGAGIAGAVLAVWAVGYAFRAFGQAIFGGNSSTKESE
jgi:hypothetical protein